MVAGQGDIIGQTRFCTFPYSGQTGHNPIGVSGCPYGLKIIKIRKLTYKEGIN